MDDRFAEFDAAYVLGALDPAERHEFEAHLATCADCRARVDEIAGLPARMASLSLEAFTEPDPVPPPELMLNLLRSARRERNRRRTLTGAAAAVIAAAAVGVTVLATGGHGTSGSQAVAMHQLVPGPLTATASFESEGWGTRIVLHCQYAGGYLVNGQTYSLLVVPRSGGSSESGTWTVEAGGTTDYTGATSVQRSQIEQIEVRTSAGQEILSLDL